MRRKVGRRYRSSLLLQLFPLQKAYTLFPCLIIKMPFLEGNWPFCCSCLFITFAYVQYMQYFIAMLQGAVGIFAVFKQKKEGMVFAYYGVSLLSQ